MSEEDPKELARKEVQRPETQRLLRQFLKLESGLGNSAAFRAGYEAAFAVARPFDMPLQCASCAYDARNQVEKEHHERMAGHVVWGAWSETRS